MRYISLAAFVRNEALYLEEWVKFHSGIGIEHFYLYENDSTDNTVEIIKELSLRYPITTHTISGEYKLAVAYNECLKTYRRASRWIAFLDCDEFLVTKEPLHKLMRTYEMYPGLTVHWRLFGSNGHKTYTPIPVVERFIRRDSAVSYVCKSIIDPLRSGDCYHSHRFRHYGYPVDEHCVPITTVVARTDTVTADIIQVNHYAVKSYEECIKRRSARRPFTKIPYEPEAFFKALDRNDVEDIVARDIWKQL